MNWSERVFSVVGTDGLARRGVLTAPLGGGGNLAAILLPAGLKDRVGPHRLYVHLARELASQGIVTLRFDPLGIGESDGQLEAAYNGRHYRRIQQGLYVEDTLLAMQALGTACGVERFVLAGLCGGAVSAQLVADRTPHRVAGVISLSSVAVLDDEAPAASRTRSETLSHTRSYLGKAFRAAAWRRVLRGEGSLRNVFATLAAFLGLGLERLGLKRRSWPNENALFFSSFRNLQKQGVPHLFVFGERDARWLAFRDMVVDGFLGGAMEGPGYRICVIPEGNHEFYLSDWQAQLLEHVRHWTRECLRKTDAHPPPRQRSMAS